MITISVFWTIILVVIVYAGIQHLLNWWFRKDDTHEFVVLLFVVEIISTVSCCALIYTILQNQL